MGNSEENFQPECPVLGRLVPTSHTDVIADGGSPNTKIHPPFHAPHANFVLDKFHAISYNTSVFADGRSEGLRMTEGATTVQLRNSG